MTMIVASLAPPIAGSSVRSSATGSQLIAPWFASCGTERKRVVDGHAVSSCDALAGNRGTDIQIDNAAGLRARAAAGVRRDCGITGGLVRRQWRQHAARAA
ncbi:MAG: hypothetical protein U0Z44_02040 [Kouleothrix sp.]